MNTTGRARLLIQKLAISRSQFNIKLTRLRHSRVWLVELGLDVQACVSCSMAEIETLPERVTTPGRWAYEGEEALTFRITLLPLDIR